MGRQPGGVRGLSGGEPGGVGAYAAVTHLLDRDPGAVWRLFVYERVGSCGARYVGNRGVNIKTRNEETAYSSIVAGGLISCYDRRAGTKTA